MWHRLYCVFTYIYHLLIEKDIYDHQNVLIKLPCVCVHLSSRDLLISLVRVTYFLNNPNNSTNINCHLKHFAYSKKFALHILKYLFTLWHNRPWPHSNAME